MRKAPAYWYSDQAPVYLLPLSALFLCLSSLRRLLFALGIKRSYALPVPVIVVGNINVGGTGKTPLTVWLVKLLRQAGYKPGIITRGYGGEAQRWPQQVRADSDPRMVGDEPVLLARQCACPVVAGPDRVQAGRALLEYSDCDIIISDDGLQHYRLRRDLELVVIDGARGFGNGRLLPAGPLRERPTRLQQVDFVINNGGPLGIAPQGATPEVLMYLQQGAARNLVHTDRHKPLMEFVGQPVHAVAGIGHPRRFFDSLSAQGLDVVTHAFDDHHAYVATDFGFATGQPVLMTEKDAVKCARFAQDDWWWVPVEASFGASFAQQFLQRVEHVSAVKRAANKG